MIVISVDIRETRVALIENGIIAELHIERRGHTTGGSTVGSVYLGKVTRVLPGLQAAFIDIGQERAAFLHVEDLIRPDDFETYLAGGRKLARTQDEGGPAEGDEEEEEAGDAAPVEGAVVEAAPASPPPGEEQPTSPPRRDDLEQTVSYPNWPHPPSAKLRDEPVQSAEAVSAPIIESTPDVEEDEGEEEEEDRGEG